MAKRTKLHVANSKNKDGPTLLGKWLEENGETLLSFGVGVGCCKQSVGALKNGTFSPGLALAVRIEEATGIPPKSWVSGQ